MIIKEISMHIKSRFRFIAEPRTIHHYLLQWEVGKHVRTDDTPQLHVYIAALFYQSYLLEQTLLMALKSEGFRINARALAYIWLKLGMR